MTLNQLLMKYSAGSAQDTSYLNYETFFRGTERTLVRRKEELRSLVREVRSRRPMQDHKWLDLACGNGLLLDVLREEGIEAYGIEMDPGLVATCTANGHAVFCGDVRLLMDELNQHSLRFDVVTCLHLIEHLDGENAERLIMQISEVLHPHGSAVIATPNTEDMRVMLGSFYRDPTHIRPYPVELIEFYCVKAGLKVILTNKYDRFISDRANVVTSLAGTEEALAKSRAALSQVTLGSK